MISLLSEVKSLVASHTPLTTSMIQITHFSELYFFGYRNYCQKFVFYSTLYPYLL